MFKILLSMLLLWIILDIIVQRKSDVVTALLVVLDWKGVDHEK